MAKRSGTEIRTKIYNKFKGVDFTTDPSLVDDSRSPWATNMVSDEGGMPEKRTGYRILYKLPSTVIEGTTHTCGKVLGLTYAEFRYDNITVSDKTEGMSATVNSHSTFYDTYKKSGTVLLNSMYSSGVLYVSFRCNVSGTWQTLTSFSATADSTGVATIISRIEAIGITTSGWSTSSNSSVTLTVEHDDSRRHYIAVGEKKIMYRWFEDGTPTVIYCDSSTLDPAPNFTSATFAYLNKKLLIFVGNNAFIYNGESVSLLTSDPYVPITIIGRTPSGGGDTYEGVNYLTGKQEIRAMGDGSTTKYILPYDSVDSIDEVKVNDTVTTAYTYTAGTNYITFTTAPSTPSVSGQDNVYITFTHNTDGYAERITECTIAIAWGVSGTSDRIVLAGNPAYPNQDFICGYNEPTYWPDTNYSVVGTNQTAIVGYRRLGEQLAIFKEDNGQDSTVFLRSGELDSDGEAQFTVFPCIAGVGGVSPNGCGNILNEQMVLTGNGVFAITTNTITSEKVAENRSLRIDAQLTKEDLTNAKVTNYKNLLLIFVDGKVYGLDGKQAKNYQSRNDLTFTYEAFYWEDIPANCVMRAVTGGEESLYFGDTNGIVYKFNSDIDTVRKFSDEKPITFSATSALTESEYVFIYDGENWTLDGETISLATYGVTAPTSPKETARIEISKTDSVYYAHYYTPIEAVWATPADDDGDAMVYKTLLKKGNAVTIKPYARSSAKILMRTDKDPEGWEANEGTMDIFDWTDIDFERFTFSANDAPSEIPVNRKVKNYKRLQIIVKNDVVNEGFGVFGITKHYVTGNFAKR